MNTITTTASTSVSILGIDLGKCKSVACRAEKLSWLVITNKRRPRDNGAVERLWRLSLEPLLREYLSGLRGRERDDELQRLRNVFFSPPEADE
jgi:hypothetical protein